MDEDAPLTALHPNHVKALRLAAIAFTLPPFVVATVWEVIGLVPTGTALIPVIILAAWFIIRAPLRRHAASGYTMAADRLRIVRGLLWRKDTLVPFGRVQHIDVERNPLERHYGLATLVLHTAGTHNASIRLSGIGEEDALAMREAIREKIGREIP